MFGLEIWLRIEIKTLYEQVDSLNKASVKNIRTETNYQDGCRNTFCTSSFNPNRKYYLDHAHITIYFSPMIRILLPYMNKFIHLLLSLNMASPFEDWDMGRFTTREYKERQKLTKTEMAWSLSVNIIFSLTMMVPLWYTG